MSVPLILLDIPNITTNKQTQPLLTSWIAFRFSSAQDRLGVSGLATCKTITTHYHHLENPQLTKDFNLNPYRTCPLASTALWDKHALRRRGWQLLISTSGWQWNEVLRQWHLANTIQGKGLLTITFLYYLSTFLLLLITQLLDTKHITLTCCWLGLPGETRDCREKGHSQSSCQLLTLITLGSTNTCLSSHPPILNM